LQKVKVIKIRNNFFLFGHAGKARVTCHSQDQLRLCDGVLPPKVSQELKEPDITRLSLPKLLKFHQGSAECRGHETMTKMAIDTALAPACPGQLSQESSVQMPIGRHDLVPESIERCAVIR
jgi:hypothetical protein